MNNHSNTHVHSYTCSYHVTVALQFIACYITTFQILANYRYNFMQTYNSIQLKLVTDMLASYYPLMGFTIILVIAIAISISQYRVGVGYLVIVYQPLPRK